MFEAEYKVKAVKALETFLKNEREMVTEIRVLLGDTKYWYLTMRKLTGDIAKVDRFGIARRILDVEEVCPGWWKYRVTS